MKKYLYGTTALAVIGLAAGPVSAAEPLHMELGGFYQQFFGFSDTGTSGEGEEVNYQNAEIYIKMRGEFDNGLRIGGRIELEGENGGDQIDQAYLILAGGLGELRIGAVNSGRYTNGWSTDAPNVGVPINSGWTSSWLGTSNTTGGRFRSVALSTVIDASNDEQKLTYFTPRFNGFQLTGSWTPAGHDIASGSVGQGGESPFAPSSDANTYTNGWDVGVSYTGTFDQVSIDANGGLAGASAPDSAEVAGFDDYLAYNGGLALGWGGFVVAGSFAVIDEGLSFQTGGTANAPGILGSPAALNTASSEGRSFNVGASYSTGPWGFSVTYFNGQEEAVIANPGDEENEFYAAAVSYTLGPGLRTSLTFLAGEKQDDLGGAANVASGDSDARAVMVGIHAGF